MKAHPKNARAFIETLYRLGGAEKVRDFIAGANRTVPYNAEDFAHQYLVQKVAWLYGTVPWRVASKLLKDLGLETTADTRGCYDKICQRTRAKPVDSLLATDRLGSRLCLLEQKLRRDLITHGGGRFTLLSWKHPLRGCMATDKGRFLFELRDGRIIYTKEDPK